MTPERWEQINKLYYAALDVVDEERTSFLNQACGSDGELRSEVESLLKMHGQARGFLGVPALQEVARELKVEALSLLGQCLGSYHIQGVLGAGGMGEVYKAWDPRLNRTVAIKVLPVDQVMDSERKRRFIQEARAASALNHPNIITIHDIGRENDVDFIVMEYVSGKTLDLRIPRKGMRLDEALRVAIQMADALSKAHSAGIIHRDLKPTNIMITEDGLVKVLDFGLAKLTETKSAQEGTRTPQTQTEEGMIIGTLSYMSPEQAGGKKVDARSDIFSFGAVLYEMVTGRKAFEGDSMVSTLAAIVKQEPKAITQLVPDSPHELERIINRCLRKDPARRFHHMQDLKVELEELKEESDSGKVAGTPAAHPTHRSWLWAGAAFIVVAMAVAVWLFRGTAQKPGAPLEVIPLTSYEGSEQSPSFSPDGNQVVFSWNGEKQDNFDICVKLIGSPTHLQLTTDPGEDFSPAFSPDGRSIGFFRLSKDRARASFMVIPAIGGSERLVADIAVPKFYLSHYSFSWFPDSKWVVVPGLTLLSTETGEMSRLTLSPTNLPPDDAPALSPDGRMVAFSRLSAEYASDIYLLGLNEQMRPKGEPRRLTSSKGMNFPSAWTPNGHEIVFISFSFGPGGSLWRVSTSGGEPEKLPYTGPGAFDAAISRNGNRLVYSHLLEDSNIWYVSLSGVGVASRPPAKLIASTRSERAPQYSPDGKRIAFESDRSGVYGLWISDADGSHATELFARPGSVSGTPHWSPDGQQIAFHSIMEGKDVDIYVMRASGGKPVRLTTDPAEDDVPSWSRDGNWIYFASKRTGQYEGWKVPAAGGEAVRITRNGGGPAVESPDGKSIYYIKGDYYSGSLWRMPLNGGGETQVLPSVNLRTFALVKEGIYFISESKPDGKSSIEFLNLETGQIKSVIPVSRPSVGLSLSPDGRSLLFTQGDEASDLMLVENFR